MFRATVSTVTSNLLTGLAIYMSRIQSLISVKNLLLINRSRYCDYFRPVVESGSRKPGCRPAHRIGQDKGVFVYKLITEDSVEEKIMVMQQKKQARADNFYKGGKKEEALLLTADDLTELFQPISGL